MGETSMNINTGEHVTASIELLHAAAGDGEDLSADPGSGR
jgi:hypothetical protein